MSDRKVGNDPSFNRAEASEEYGAQISSETAPADVETGAVQREKTPVDEIVSGAIETDRVQTDGQWKLERAIEAPTASDVMHLIKDALESLKEGGGKEEDAASQFEAFKESFLKRAVYLRAFALLLKNGSDAYDALCSSFLEGAKTLLPRIQEFNRKVGSKSGADATETKAQRSFIRAFKNYQKGAASQSEFFSALQTYNAFAQERNRQITQLAADIDRFNIEVTSKNLAIEELNEARSKIGVGSMPLLPKLELPQPMQVFSAVESNFAKVALPPRREISLHAIDQTGKLKDDLLQNWIPNLKSDLMFLSAREGKDEIEVHFSSYMNWLHLPWDRAYYPDLSLNVLKTLRKEGGLPSYLNLIDSSMMPYLGTGLIDYVLRLKLPDLCRPVAENMRLLIIDLIAQAGVMSSTPALLMALERSPEELDHGELDLIVATAFSKSIRSIISSSLIEESVDRILSENGIKPSAAPDKELINLKLVAVCNLTIAFAAINRIASALKLPGLAARVLSEALQYAGIKGFHPRLTLKEVLSNGAFDIAIAKAIKEKLVQHYQWESAEADALVSSLFTHLSKEAFWKHDKDALIPLIALNMERAGFTNASAAKAIAFQVYSDLLGVIPSENMDSGEDSAPISAWLINDGLLAWGTFNPDVDKETKQNVKEAVRGLLRTLHQEGETILFNELILRLTERIQKEGVEKELAKKMAESVGEMVVLNLEARGSLGVSAAEVGVLFGMIVPLFEGYTYDDLIQLPIAYLLSDKLSVMHPQEIVDRLRLAKALPSGDDASHAFISMELKIPFEWVKAVREAEEEDHKSAEQTLHSISKTLLKTVFSSSETVAEEAADLLPPLFSDKLARATIRLTDTLNNQGVDYSRASQVAATTVALPYAWKSEFDLRKAVYLSLILLGEGRDVAKGASLNFAMKDLRVPEDNLKEEVAAALARSKFPYDFAKPAAGILIALIPFIESKEGIKPWKAGIAKLLFGTGLFTPQQALKIVAASLDDKVAQEALKEGFGSFFTKSIPSEAAEPVAQSAASLLLETMDAFVDEREFIRKVEEIALFLTGIVLSSKEAVLAGLRLNAVVKGGALKAMMEEQIRKKGAGEMEADLLASKAMINLFAMQMPLQQAFGMSEIALSTDKVIRTRIGVLEKRLEGMLIAKGVEGGIASKIAQLAARETLQQAEKFSDERVFKEVLFLSLQALFRRAVDSDPFFEKPDAAAGIVRELAVTELMRREILQEDLKRILEGALYLPDKAFFTAADLSDSLFRSPQLFENEEVFAGAVRDALVAWGLIDEAAADLAVKAIDFGLIVHGSPLRTLEQSGHLPLPELIGCFLTQAAEENSFLKWGSQELVRELLLLVFGTAAAGEQIRHTSSDPSLLKLVKDNLSLIISARKENKLKSGLKKVLAEFARSVAHPTIEYFILLTKATKPAEAIISSTHLTLNSREEKEAEIKKTLGNVV
ncbi:hypothetical protein [Estrella lausannensis]|uniref:Uncharacterized protein n=1 Tax=Estrella lausannensis TaxID=483423 RepID=A0A0H5DTK0_9BACT|nr:hypothetical protein [Estrella lausannensis]CRX39184.1 hypothetical protein ELAC_1859 [Estrella lausannensis]